MRVIFIKKNGKKYLWSKISLIAGETKGTMKAQNLSSSSHHVNERLNDHMVSMRVQEAEEEREKHHIGSLLKYVAGQLISYWRLPFISAFSPPNPYGHKDLYRR